MCYRGPRQGQERQRPLASTLRRLIQIIRSAALVIAQPGELAVQSQKEFFRFGRSKGVKVRSVYGGPASKENRALKSGAHSRRNTWPPFDLIKRKALKLNQIETLILDEAGRNAYQLLEDIESIIPVQKVHQTLPFSATMPDAIKRIGVKFMKEPEHAKIAAKELTTELVDRGHYIRVKEK